MVDVKCAFSDSKYLSKQGRARVGGAMLIILLSTSSILGIIAASISVHARIFSGTVDIEIPQSVVPGGYIIFSTDPVPPDAGGGSIYFYLSKDDDSEISSGDKLMGKMDKDDVEASGTLKVPTSTGAGEYHLKMTDLSRSGAACLVSGSTVEVITADRPTITVDPDSDVVGTEVTVEGEDISEDFDSVELFWNDYTSSLGTFDVVDEAFTVICEIPNAFMGDNFFIVLLHDEDDDEYLGTYGIFDVIPSVFITPPEAFSIRAGSSGPQDIMIDAYGFPKGTIDQDTIEYVIKSFLTGATIDTMTSSHEEVDVNEIVGLEGRIEDLHTTLEDVEEGLLDIRFQIDGETIDLKGELISSTIGGLGEFKAKMGSTSGVMGDKVKFWGINFPDVVNVEIVYENGVSKTIAAGESDANGAWRSTILLEDIPGGKFNVRVRDATNSRHTAIGTFEIKPTLSPPEKAVVEELIDIMGEGFQVGSKYDTIEIGGKKVEIDVTVGSDGIFEALDVEVPHASGGGQDVAVKILGKDADGKAITLTTSIVIEPEAVSLQALTPSGTWRDISGEVIFAGTPLKFKGMGFKGKETVKITFENGAGVKKDATFIYSKSESNGDLDYAFYVPTGRDFGSADEWTLTIAGKTKGNEWVGEVNTEDLDDGKAKIYFGLKKDGSLTNEVKGGESITVIGVGFETRELTLEFGGEEVTDVTSSNGYFNQKITVPKIGNGAYRLEATETGTKSIIVFLGIPAIFLNAPPNMIYFIFVDPVYASGAESTYDVASGGIVYGLCLNVQNLGFDTTEGWLLPSGAINTATISGSWVALFGGPGPNVAVRHYEEAGLTPLKYSSNATHHIFMDQSGTVVAALPSATLDGGHEDMFLVETFADAGNTFFVVYGFGWRGTWAGGIFYKDVISKNINDYKKAYYVFHWVDDSGQDGIPQSSEILEFASEP